MNLEDSDDWWNTSDIQNTSFKFDDEEDTLVGNRSSANDGNLSLVDLVSGVSLSGKSDLKLPAVDLYSLVSKKSVDYILNEPTTQDYLSTPFKDRKSNQTSIDISNVVSNMCCGLEECLEPYKSFESKRQLLTCAVSKKNNNVILKVICFLAKSLKPVLMNEIFLNEPKAFDLYVNFLISKGDVSKAIELLDILGYNRDAGILQFASCVSCRSNQLSNLRSISNSYFLMDSDKKFIDNFIKFLEWQNSFDKKLVQYTAAKCLAHVINKNPQNVVDNFCELLHINEKLFHWIFLIEKSKSQDWYAISQLFVSKKWHGGKRVSTQIPVKDIIRELAINNAPENELKFFLDSISQTDTRLVLAKKYKCPHAVVDILLDQKDRQALLVFKSQQPAQSESYFYAENALRNNSTKWKN